MISLQILTDALICFPKKKNRKLKTRLLVSIHAALVILMTTSVFCSKIHLLFERFWYIFYKNSEHMSKAKLLRQENMTIKAQSPEQKQIMVVVKAIYLKQFGFIGFAKST